ncbi:hypothetical protein PROFUN_01500 [Planoprotostelium fungivorum]|uniref:Uncharacterized protein n=1 Tax=Planoprotostelium fungivorum TaxID=1890364 RepID=A0A2P6NTQ1_9EUKA|nr:hypothetical protein PROFUN_01500 [Planoprotostelium fungivorum]
MPWLATNFFYPIQMTAHLNAKPGQPLGSTPTPNGTQGPHSTQACPYLHVSPLDCRVQNYQLASNGLVAPNGVKLTSE